MPLDLNIIKEIPDFESFSAKDKQKFILFVARIQDLFKTISNQAQKTGETVEQVNVEVQQQTQQIPKLVQAILTPMIGLPRDPLLQTLSTNDLDASTQLQNLVYASPDGSSGNPDFRALVDNDLPHTRKLRETSGPTNLTIGAVADGQAFVRSGATIIGQTISTKSLLDYLNL